MIDREKAIKGLEVVRDAIVDGYIHEPDRAVNAITDAIAMLKTQEAREPHYTTLRYLVNGMEVTVRHPECPRCIENGLALWDAEIEKGQAYCKRCGQAVKWCE